MIPMLLLYYLVLAMFFSLVGIRFSKYRVNIIVIQTVIKVYLSYWIILFNFLASFLFINLFKGMDYYNDWLVNIRFNTLDWFMVLVILLVSSCVIVNSIDYLTIMESYLFLVYISLFQFCMITFVLSNDLLIAFLNWDWLGLISYLLINFWSSKLNCGIKAVLYNKCGDCFFLLVLAFSYSFINYYVHLPLSILFNSLISFIFSFIGSALSFYCWISFSLLFIFFSKSAQFPFSSWLLNAMSAPTPISALLHSSTMVIAGVYLGLIIDSTIILVINSFDWFYVGFILFPLFSLLWTLFKAISLTDIKSIIAFSTISQISYMFLAILIFPLVCLFHIIIHALFKSLLFFLISLL
jgi:NADH:ubiquinone oxidoreductase subunit 5 (subunit L)/multisubunit Na+/H+ antiporter MnhA subunit